MPPTFVILGASLAGGTAAATLREEGFDGRIVLVGEEPQPPYERPPLSKKYLQGQQPFERCLVHPPGFYEANGVETRFGVRATRIDPAGRTVELADGERLAYDRVLVTTGTRNRRLPIPGLDLPGVYGLRSVAEADRIAAEARPGRKAVVVGMGFIGAEVAASLRQLGLAVTAIEFFKVPLFRVLGEEVGRAVAGLHRDHGVDLVFEDSVVAFEGAGQVERVVTKAGRRINCDFAVVGLGVEPAAEVVAGTGVTLDNGIVVDAYCRTSVDGIYAAGDVANHYHPVFERQVRVEHWQNALKQGAAAARSMLGKGEPYAEVHWFWSDQYDANLQYAGFHTEWDELILRGSLEGRRFVAFYLKEGRVLAAAAMNQGRDLRRTLPVIASRVQVDVGRLRDESVDLRTLAGARTVSG
jgi:3-phenylpropionate/trans-cinnamate dioxygenase ferredoxin reductase subunit